jgi:hypothetical protein
MGVRVVSIVRLTHLVAFVSEESGRDQELADIEAYRKTYGVEY